MGKIYIDHFYLCSSFSEVKELSTNFANFKFVFYSLGVKRTIRPKCYIRKRDKREKYTHTLSLRYKFEFTGDFGEYGFLDHRTLKKHPELPNVLLKIDDSFDRWEAVHHYDDDYRYDPVFYEDFQHYYDKRLKELIEKLYLTEIIALPRSISWGLYSIFYEECGKVYEKRYLVENGLLSFIRSLDSLQDLESLDFQLTWNWVNQERKYERDKWHSEVRPLTALSYTINRKPFEQFFYAILGLESVFTNGNRKESIKGQLKSILPKVFPNITEDDVEVLYKLRSDFVHGNITFPNFYQSNDMLYTDYAYMDYAKKADYLLLRTIQLLVKNNAYKAKNDGSGCIVFVGE